MSDLRSEFLVDDGRRAITIHRQFNGPRQLVWDCYTKSELLDRWFAPKGLTTRTRHMDFRAGGYWHYAMIAPDGQEYWSRLNYQTVDPIDGYTAEDVFCDEAGTVNADLPGSHWDVSFVDQGARTLVTVFIQFVSLEGLQASIDMGMREGMASTLERLDELLAALPAS